MNEPNELLEPEQSEPGRKVYTNRNLDLGSIDQIGFDMDYTLAQYKQRPMDELSIKMTVQKLIENHGYPEIIRDAVLDHEFIIRGLVVDKETGFVFKLDANRRVGRCYHGYQRVERAQFAARQVDEKIRLETDRYARVDTLFSLAETTLVAGLIEHYRGLGTPLPWTYRKLYDDVRQSIDEAHADNSLKHEILGHLGAYFERDPDLGPTLHKLRSAGKKLFLLTNSEWYYTDAVMTYLLRGALSEYRSWRDYFDVVMVRGRKPDFFTGDAPFMALRGDGSILGEAQRFDDGGIYQGGNLRDLERMLGVDGDGILYVGDHIFGDIVRSKKSGWWRTALVVQEMEETIRLTYENRAPIRRIHQLEDAALRLDDEINEHLTVLKSLGRPKSPALEATQRSTQAGLLEKRAELMNTLTQLDTLEADVDARFNAYWGRVFRERNERSLFGAQVQGYADIYTSRVSNLLAYSPNQAFRAPREVMPHERG